MSMRRPGGELATRPLHFMWICDCSGSMGEDGKIQSLNNAIREAIPHMQKVGDENPNAEILVRAIKFSSGVEWHVPRPTRISDFHWTDLYAEGETDMGKALSAVAQELKIPPMAERALPPVLVLVSDGHPTDDFSRGLKELMAQPWGKKAVRIGIAIGQDADTDVLEQFIGNHDIKVLQANNPEALARSIKLVSTIVLKSASSPASQGVGATYSANVPIPTLTDLGGGPASAADVW